MTTTAVSLLPVKAARRLEALLVAGWTGKVELNVKDGNVLAWAFTGREPDPDDEAVTRTVTVSGRG